MEKYFKTNDKSTISIDLIDIKTLIVDFCDNKRNCKLLSIGDVDFYINNSLIKIGSRSFPSDKIVINIFDDYILYNDVKLNITNKNLIIGHLSQNVTIKKIFLSKSELINIPEGLDDDLDRLFICSSNDDKIYDINKNTFLTISNYSDDVWL
jgi:hypothetical protein